MKLLGKRIYLDVLEKADCKKLYEDFEYDFTIKAEPLYLGQSINKSEEWFEEIQNKQGETHIRLGIFLLDGTVIGDIALQDIEWMNRSCSLGMGFSKICHRGKGYGSEAMRLLIDYAFNNLGLERVTANTLEHNIGGRQ